MFVKLVRYVTAYSLNDYLQTFMLIIYIPFKFLIMLMLYFQELFNLIYIVLYMTSLNTFHFCFLL